MKPYALLPFIAALACASCNEVYCGGLQSNPYAVLSDVMIFRVVAQRAVADHDDTLAIFTHREQYDGTDTSIDFENEEVVRITARTGPGAQVTTVARSDAVVAITLDARKCPRGVPAATWQFDVVIPLTEHVPYVYVDRGAQCREEAH